jgi:carbamoyltransferase
MNILGLSAFYHDSAAALVCDGEITAAAQEERFTRKKHDSSFPHKAINYCLEEKHIKPHELDYVVFYDKPFLKFERILETYLHYAPGGIKSFIKAMPLWIKQKLWVKILIEEELKGFKGKILFSEHHRSHAGSAFYPSPFKEAAIITVDGVGEWTTTSIGFGKENKITILKELHFPHSLGMLYSAFTYFTGFKVNSGEYKVMGLSPYGEPKYVQVILDNLIDLKEDGSFKLNMNYFNFAAGLTMINNKFSELFGMKPRTSEIEITQKEMDLARSVQEVTEIIMLRIARHIRKLTNAQYLCLAGGVALNCVANGKILKENIYNDIWIQPAAGDAGGALGAALCIWFDYLNNTRAANNHDFMQKGSYLGPAFSNKDIFDFLKKHTFPYTYFSDDKLIAHAARLITEENVIGWFQGRMEFGPRALGSRSILGDARSPDMQKKMNLKIKFRESFRPFGPSIINEEVSNYFEIDRASPYMLLVANVQKHLRREMTAQEKMLFGIDKLNIVRSSIPAVTHVDYSARIQTVHQETNKKFWKLIRTIQDITGFPVIVNTSFNVRGEPIVCSLMDAYKCFMRTAMDYLVLGNYVLDKKNQPEFIDKINWNEDLY